MIGCVQSLALQRGLDFLFDLVRLRSQLSLALELPHNERDQHLFG